MCGVCVLCVCGVVCVRVCVVCVCVCGEAVCRTAPQRSRLELWAC